MISKQNQKKLLAVFGLALCAVLAYPILDAEAVNWRRVGRALRNVEVIEVVQSPRPFVTLPGLRVWVKKKLLINPPGESSYYLFQTVRSGLTDENGRAVFSLEQSYVVGTSGDTHRYHLYINPTDPGDLSTESSLCGAHPTRGCIHYWTERQFELMTSQPANQIHRYIIPESDDPYREWRNE